MKKFISILAAGFIACMPLNAQKYIITGTAEGTEEGDTVFLCKAQGYGLVNTDTAVIRNGQFTFTGDVPAEGYAMRYIRPTHAGETKGLCMAQVVLEEAEIKVRTFKSDPKYKDGEVESTGKNHQLLTEYRAATSGIGKGMDDIYRIVLEKKGTAEEQKNAQAKVDSVRKLIVAAKRDFLIQHMNAPVPVCDMMLSEIYTQVNDKDKSILLELFKAKMPEGANYKRLAADAAATAPTAVGKKYTDFGMQDTDGKEVKVSDFMGNNRYVLIDFWASWCGPCRAEMPHVVEAYNRFHQKGFEVVGISLDNKKEAWLKAIKDLSLPWPQMSDLKGWQCQGAAIYNVRAIPANVLVDANGIIVARDLRGQDLIDELERLMK